MPLMKFEIDEIFDSFILPKNNTEYLSRYARLPLEANSKRWRWENKDFPRVIALLEFDRFIRSGNFSFGDVLSFNGVDDPEYEYIGCRKIYNYDHEGDPIKHDLHSLDLEKKDFDFFMSNQTLEHLYDPCLALRRIHKHLKIGGVAYMNLPCVNIPHSTPYHYYTGFTPVGLGCVVRQAGFRILDIGFWGNVEYHNLIFNSGKWPDYRKLKNYVSEFERPVITWVFAQKDRELKDDDQDLNTNTSKDDNQRLYLQLQKKAEELQQAIDNIYASKSWQITKPVRTISTFARKFLRSK